MVRVVAGRSEGREHDSLGGDRMLHCHLARFCLIPLLVLNGPIDSCRDLTSPYPTALSPLSPLVDVVTGRHGTGRNGIARCST